MNRRPTSRGWQPVTLQGWSAITPLLDGNKRAAFLAVGLFLELNGFQLVADPADAAHAVIALASGDMAEAEFAAWVRMGMKR